MNKEVVIGDCRLILGDCLTVLPTLAPGSVDAVVTSPPYDDLRVYGGHSWDFDKTSTQLTRILKYGGVIVWVIGDATIDGSETLTSMRHAIHFKDVCGLNIHDTMIFKKAAVGACGSNLAYWQAWEYMLVISKGTPKTINRLADRKNSSAGMRKWPSQKTETVGTRQNRTATVSQMGTRDNVWTYQTGWFSGDDITEHPAPFPEALAKDHIESWTNPGYVVLDPFMGSGTTGVACIRTGRKFIGIEIDPMYFDIACKRVERAWNEERTSLLTTAARAETTQPELFGEK